jgi:hypothetical protein
MVGVSFFKRYCHIETLAEDLKARSAFWQFKAKRQNQFFLALRAEFLQQFLSHPVNVDDEP